MLLRQLFDPHLAQYAYLIGCPRTKEALVVDPERDIDRYLGAAQAEGLRIVAVAETHIHADYLSGAQALAEAAGARLYLSAEGGRDWQYGWVDGRTDVTLLRNGDAFTVGGVRLEALHTPGHTPEHLAFLVTDGAAPAPMGLLSGDFVFVGDLGRPDLLEEAVGERGAAEASARRLLASAQALGGLPDHLLVWPGHGAGSACGKALGAVPHSTLGYERRVNPALRAARDEAAFLAEVLGAQPTPPRYFARMKRLNRDGVPPLERLPAPRALAGDDLAALGAAVVLDTRSRGAFFAGHLPGSLLAPFDASFSAVAGSYLEPDDEVVLVADEAHVDEIVRVLVRIGIDRVAAYVTPEALAAWADGTDRLEMLKAIDFAELDGRRHYTNVAILDVRRAEERALRHVPGSLHIPHLRLPDHLGDLPRDRTILVHCAAGARAAAAAALLHRHGFYVAAVDDAFAHWKERHLEPGATAGAH